MNAAVGPTEKETTSRTAGKRLSYIQLLLNGTMGTRIELNHIHTTQSKPTSQQGVAL
jgi:hypothetical protein